jgi:predicted anti-sigma-YlaC factor YlaD
MTAGRDLTCRDVVGFLDAYHAGEIGAEARAVFDAHVAACPDCRDFLGQYVATVRLAKDAFGPADEPAVPEGLVDAILAARRSRT